jgi:antitoxin ParD1/3/4
MREIVYSRVNPLLQLMSITLKPEQERIVQAQIQLGKFATPDQAIDLALSLLEKWDELEQFESEWFEETRLKLASASAQIERGEVLDGPTVIAALQTKLNQARAVAECQDL